MVEWAYVFVHSLDIWTHLKQFINQGLRHNSLLLLGLPSGSREDVFCAVTSFALLTLGQCPCLWQESPEFWVEGLLCWFHHIFRFSLGV